MLPLNPHLKLEIFQTDKCTLFAGKGIGAGAHMGS